MKLFEVDENSEVKINSPWIKLVPEFRELFIITSKKLAYDKNTYAKKLLAFIYFYRDFSSPLRDWEDEARFKESLKYTELTDADVKTEKVRKALEAYIHIQYEACRALKTYEASMKGLAAMDKYLNEVDFTKVDKQGKLLYTPNQYVANLALVNKAYDELRKLANSIQHDLTQTTGIRGKAVMGDKEMKTEDEQMDNTAWDENVIAPDGKTQWKDIDGLINNLKKK